MSKYVILGGGMVAGYATKELVERGLKPAELTIVSADSALPYERPPLSKSFLAGKDTEENIRINPETLYQQHEVEVKLRSEVRQVDTRQRLLYMASGGELPFEKLVIATGARPRMLDVPGGNLSGVCYLRSLEDSKRIQAHAASAKRALVIGGGFIGMEVAAVLAQKQIAVTMVLREDRIWKNFFSPGMSRFFENYYAARGVEFLRQAQVAELRGSGGVTSAMIAGKPVACDLVVAGIGVRPVTEPLENSGIELADGVVVNEYLETSVRDVYAAGDVANYVDTLFGKRRRVEHWDNAVSQGQHCARMLLGERAPFVHVPYFFSDVFDLSYEFWGDPGGADRIVERGDLSSTSFSVWWLRDERLVAAFTMNRPDDERNAAPRWIASKKRVSGETFRAPGTLTES